MLLFTLGLVAFLTAVGVFSLLFSNAQATCKYMTLIDALFLEDFTKTCHITIHKLLETERLVGILDPSEVSIVKFSDKQLLWDPSKKPGKPRKKRARDSQECQDDDMDGFEWGGFVENGALQALPLQDRDDVDPAADQEIYALDEAALAGAADGEESDWEDQMNQIILAAMAARVEENAVGDDDFELPDGSQAVVQGQAEEAMGLD